MAKVAVLGTGAMGSRIARALLRGGHEVCVYNRTRERAYALSQDGATVASSPRAAVASADVVLSMVSNDAASREVWLHPQQGALLGLSPEALAIESSTLSPSWLKELELAMLSRAARFLAAPVVGSRPQADDGKLVILAGGEPSTLELATPVLSKMSASIHYVGDVRAAAAMKLAINALFAIQVAAASELLPLLAEHGVAGDVANKILTSLPVTSPALSRILGLIASSSFSPNFPIDLVEKDLHYTLEAGGALASGLPITYSARSVFTRARELGLGELDISAVRDVYGRSPLPK